MASKQAAVLAGRLRAGEFNTAPGVYDMISARLADRLGFPALYMTGSGVVASHLGLPDAGIATFTEMAERAAPRLHRRHRPDGVRRSAGVRAPP